MPADVASTGRSNSITAFKPNGPDWLTVSGPMIVAEINDGPEGEITCVLSGMLVANVPLPAVSTCKTRLFGFEKSATTRICWPCTTVTPVAVPRTTVPSPRGIEMEMSAEPFDWPVNNNVYGEFAGEVSKPRYGTLAELPSGKSTPPRMDPPGALLPICFPPPSVNRTATR